MAKLANDIEEQIDKAIAAARDFAGDEAAASVKYIASEDLFLLTLKSGVRIAIPREDLQGIADVNPAEAAKVSLEMLDTVVSWENLDIAFRVKTLADGFRGTDSWMQHLAERNQHSVAA